jgi:predicted dehydrogenase
LGKKVSIGILGAGFGLQVHLPAFQKIEACEVRALCARNPEKLKLAADRNRIPVVASDWRDLVGNPEIQALALAVPPAAQAEISLAAARAGKHLFCEKPFALNTSQAKSILEAAQANAIVHAIDFIFPELDTWKIAREVIRSGQLGQIRSTSLTWRVETFTYRTGAQNWKTTSVEGGGTLNNFASHTLHYLEWLFGPIARLAGRLLPSETEVEARVEAWAEFAAGYPATISIAADAFLGPGHKLEVYGDAGTLVLDNPGADYVKGFRLLVGNRQSGKLETVDCGPADPNPDGRVLPVSRIAGRFIESIRTSGQMQPNLQDGLRVQVLSDALRLAHASGYWQDVRLL